MGLGARPSGKRLVLRLTGVLLPVVVGLGGVELWARQQDLDHRQGQAIALQGEPLQDFVEGKLASEEWGVAYLPTDLEADRRGFATRWGACAYDHPGRTLLVFGDSTTVQGTPQNEPHGTWPARLSLPEDVQLCVVAEMGYHPGEYLALARHLREEGLEPDLTLVLLCENDLSDLQARIGVEVDGREALYQPPTHRLAFAPLWNPWLFERSEAFRFVSWRMAEAWPQHQARIPAGVAPMRESAPSLQGLQELGPTEIFYAPPLRGWVTPNPLLRHVQQQVPELHVLEWGPDPVSLRRQSDDDVHFNDRGHAVVVEAAQRAVDEHLGG